MNLHLVLPDLFRPQPDAQDAAPAPALDALERLLSRGRRTVRPAASLEQWAAERYGLPASPDLPLAALSLLADGTDPASAAWLRADPCHLRVATDHLVLVDAATFEIGRDEADALVSTLNAHFSPEGVSFLATRPDRWYVALERPPEISTVPVAEARGRSIDPILPQGVEAKRWHAFLNEAQMALHEHPVNEARERRGAPPINAVWLWGGGPLVRPASRPFGRVQSADPVVAGAAQASGAAVFALQAGAREWLGAAGHAGVEAVVLDQLRVPAAYGDDEAWRERLEDLERRWIAPAVEALGAGRIGMITLHAPGRAGSLEVETTRQDLRYFWRRVKPMHAWHPADARP